MPVSKEVLYDSALQHLYAGNFAHAAQQLEQVLLLDMNHHAAWNNRGIALQQLGHKLDAIIHYERALEITKQSEYWNNLSSVNYDLGNFDKCINAASYALGMNPKFATALMNRGAAKYYLGDMEGSLTDLHAAVEADPNHHLARLHLSFNQLRTGQFAEGWKNFEARWHVGQMPKRVLPYPEWNGEPLEGKKLLVYSEQGHGDCLQFVRLVPMVAKQHPGAVVAVEVRSPLRRIIESVRGIDEVHVYGEEKPIGVDYALPMMSLPRLLGINTEADIPNSVPYFHLSQTAKQRWADTFKRDMPINNRPYVGVCWAGMNRVGQDVASAVDARRSLNIMQMVPVFRVPGVNWVSLQKGPPAAQLPDAAPRIGMLIADWMDECDDFYDTAALIANLDLVITVDTAVAHVAGAMGIPTWVLSRFDNCWRWMGSREDSPWYPTVRQFKQATFGDWEPVIQRVASELREFAPNHLRTVA